MRLRTIIWSILLIIAGALILALKLGNPGPRLGMGVFCISTGVLALLMSNVTWFLRKTTNPEDYQGNCPVGRSCPKCEAFNLNPRTVCRVCKSDLAASPEIDAPIEANAPANSETL